MDITLSLETTDQRLIGQLMKGHNLYNHQLVMITDEVSIVHLTGDGFDVTKNDIWTFVITGVTAVSLNVVSDYIYDHLQHQPNPPVVQINNEYVEINHQNISDALGKCLALGQSVKRPAAGKPASQLSKKKTRGKQSGSGTSAPALKKSAPKRSSKSQRPLMKAKPHR